MDLFADDDPPAAVRQAEPDAVDPSAPLAERMRPRTLDDIVGQEALLGPGRPLRAAIEHDRLRSIILWGPPGHRQDDARAGDRQRDARAFHRVQRRDVGDQGDPRSDGGGGTGAPPLRRPDDPVHRRDPPLQQGAAGRLPAPRRVGRHRPDRRDDREPVVRGQLGAAVAIEGLRAEAADDQRRS